MNHSLFSVIKRLKFFDFYISNSIKWLPISILLTKKHECFGIFLLIHVVRNKFCFSLKMSFIIFNLVNEIVRVFTLAFYHLKTNLIKLSLFPLFESNPFPISTSQCSSLSILFFEILDLTETFPMLCLAWFGFSQNETQILST